MNVHTQIIEDADIWGQDRFVVFDLETIPSQNPDLLADLASNVKPPANLKKPESIEKWLTENREQAAANALSKTSFDGGLGHICSIAWCKNDGEIHVRHASSLGQEREIIEDFFADLDPYHSETLCGHNILGFDLEFLRKRAILLGVRLPPRMSFPRDPKPWDKNVLDTMSAWAGGKGRVSMDDLCKMMGIQGKDGFDGGQVAKAWAGGEHEKIKEYCRDDVWRTREILKRLLKVGF